MLPFTPLQVPLVCSWAWRYWTPCLCVCSSSRSTLTLLRYPASVLLRGGDSRSPQGRFVLGKVQVIQGRPGFVGPPCSTARRSRRKAPELSACGSWTDPLREAQTPVCAMWGEKQKGPESSAPCSPIVTLRLLSSRSAYPPVRLWGLKTLPSRVRLSPRSALGIQLSRTTAHHKHATSPPPLAVMIVSGCHGDAACTAPFTVCHTSGFLAIVPRYRPLFHRKRGQASPAHPLYPLWVSRPSKRQRVRTALPPSLTGQSPCGD